VHVHPEVRDALAAGRPVVALESTIISHGLPRPDNLRIAREIEEAVRSGGAVPATIAIIGGEPHVGLDDGALRRVAEGDAVVKVSVRDVAVLAARGGDGSTTSPRPRTWQQRRASRCSPPAGWAACIAARVTAGTSPRT
jgi:pseudouridine-5'-phosphate glycosidase